MLEMFVIGPIVVLGRPRAVRCPCAAGTLISPGGGAAGFQGPRSSLMCTHVRHPLMQINNLLFIIVASCSPVSVLRSRFPAPPGTIMVEERLDALLVPCKCQGPAVLGPYLGVQLSELAQAFAAGCEARR